jgi:hypothetical protein
MKDLRLPQGCGYQPDVTKNAPVRAICGSQDGEFWFRIASHRKRWRLNQWRVRQDEPAGLFGQLTGYTTWQQVAVSPNAKPVVEGRWSTCSLPERKRTNYIAPAPSSGGKFSRGTGGPHSNHAARRPWPSTMRLAFRRPYRRPLPDAGTHDLAPLRSHATASCRCCCSLSDQYPRGLLTFRPLDFDLVVDCGPKRAPSTIIAGAGSVPLFALLPKVPKVGEIGAKENGRDYIGGEAARLKIVSWEFAAPAAGAYEVWMQTGPCR